MRIRYTENCAHCAELCHESVGTNWRGAIRKKRIWDDEQFGEASRGRLSAGRRQDARFSRVRAERMRFPLRALTGECFTFFPVLSRATLVIITRLNIGAERLLRPGRPFKRREVTKIFISPT